MSPRLEGPVGYAPPPPFARRKRRAKRVRLRPLLATADRSRGMVDSCRRTVFYLIGAIIGGYRSAFGGSQNSLRPTGGSLLPGPGRTPASGGIRPGCKKAAKDRNPSTGSGDVHSESDRPRLAGRSV